MPPGPVILTLSSWVQQHLREVITANSQSAFTDAMNAFVAPNAQITFNGASISRADYVQQIWQPQQHESNATLSFLGIIENPKDTSAIVQVSNMCSSTLEQGLTAFSVGWRGRRLLLGEHRAAPAAVLEHRDVLAQCRVSPFFLVAL